MEQEQEQHSRYHHLRPFRDEARFRRLRQVLNLVFIVGALAGMLCYTQMDNKDTAIYILIGASVFKFVELCLRIIG